LEGTISAKPCCEGEGCAVLVATVQSIHSTTYKIRSDFLGWPTYTVLAGTGMWIRPLAQPVGWSLRPSSPVKPYLAPFSAQKCPWRSRLLRTFVQFALCLERMATVEKKLSAPSAEASFARYCVCPRPCPTKISNRDKGILLDGKYADWLGLTNAANHTRPLSVQLGHEKTFATCGIFYGWRGCLSARAVIGPTLPQQRTCFKAAVACRPLFKYPRCNGRIPLTLGFVTFFFSFAPFLGWPLVGMLADERRCERLSGRL
jgi:hypothetical protein